MNHRLVRKFSTACPTATRRDPSLCCLLPGARWVVHLAICLAMACCLAAPVTVRAASVEWSGAGFDQNWTSIETG